jgi:hypothetical protein
VPAVRGKPSRALIAGALVAVVVSLAAAAPSPAGSLYWTNINNALPPSVGRSGLDGGNVNNLFIEVPGNPYGLFVSSRYIYFTSYEFGTAGLGTIGRANLDGSGGNQGFIAGASGPADVSADDNYIYWANSSTNSIGRANLDGTGVNQDFITGTVNAATVWVDEDYVYWGNGSFSGPSSIGRANLDGTGVNQNFISGPGVRSPATVVADQNYIYWTNSQGAPTIGRADIDGSDVKGDFVVAGTSGSLPNGLAVSGRHLYWTTYSANTMGRVRKDGSDLRTSFISPLSRAAQGPGSVSVDQYVLTAATAGTGTGNLTSSPTGINCGGGASDCAEEYPQATEVTLTPTPGNDSAFAGWSGACSGTGTCTVTMDEARSVVATFNALPTSFPLSVSSTGTGTGTITSSPAGISCGTDCLQSFAPGTQVTLTASPSNDSTFTGWGGACSGTGTCTVTMSQAQNVTAGFTALAPPPSSYPLTIDDQGTGLGTVTSTPTGINCGSDCTQSFAAGSSVKLTAKPAAGSAFAGWGGACSGTGTCTLTMSQAQTVTVQFEPTNQFLILWARARGSAIHTRLRTYDDGRLAQAAVFRSGGRERIACVSASRAVKAGTTRMRCVLTGAARAARRKGAVRVELATTFTPTGGTQRTVLRTVTLRSLKPNYAG